MGHGASGAVVLVSAEGFAGGVRRVGARAGEVMPGGPAVAGFDGSLSDIGGDASDLLAALAGLPYGREDVQDAAKPEARAAATEVQREVTRERTVAAAGSTEPIVGALLRGTDAIEEAMRGVRERLGV